MLDDPGAGLPTREERRAARRAAWAPAATAAVRRVQRAARIARAQIRMAELRERMQALVEGRFGADAAQSRRERPDRGRP